MSNEPRSVAIVSPDTTDARVFARMLELELRQAGIPTVTRPAEAALVLADADGIPYKQLQALSAGSILVCYGTPPVPAPKGAITFEVPFAVPELIERLRACLALPALRPIQREQTVALPADALTVTDRAVFFGQSELPLTERERELLLYLLARRGRTVSRSELLEGVWGSAESKGSNVVDVYVRYLRKKIDDAFDVRLVHSVRGEGYCIK